MIAGLSFKRLFLFRNKKLFFENLMGEGEEGEFPPKKVQSDTQGGAGDFPTKKLARQLDFTAGFGGTVVLPEHPQPQAVAPITQPQPQTVAPPVPPSTLTVQPSVRVV